MADSPILDRVQEIIVPILTDLGLDLYDLDFGAGLLKVTVDKPGGAMLDEISLATRLINREFDHLDPVPGKYTLEVSSPGIERSLRRPDHFTRVIGATVSVRLRDVTNESRRIQGILVAADDTGITVRSEEAPFAERTVTYDQIDRARTVFVWAAANKESSAKKDPSATSRPASKKSPSASTTTPARPADPKNQEVTA
jgi:ribosome maturation factor RimP